MGQSQATKREVMLRSASRQITSPVHAPQCFADGPARRAGSFDRGGRMMAAPETDCVLATIREVITVKEFRSPPLRPLFEAAGRRLMIPMAELIADAERKLRARP